jgi:hypothetical protein
MIKVRLILMFQGRVEHDIETEIIRPRLKEIITLQEPFSSYKIKFIQHMFDKKGDFQYLMVTGIKKV